MEYKSIGINISKRRKEFGLTQEVLAEKLGLSTSYIGAIERGKKLPSLDVFINIANVLETSSDTLLSGVLKVGNEIVTSELSKQITGLSKKEQKRILNVINTMINDI